MNEKSGRRREARKESGRAGRGELALGVAAGLLALVCVAAHFAGRGDAPPPKSDRSVVRERPGPERAVEGKERLRAKWEAWRERHRVSTLDTREQRDEKRFRSRMRALGTSPVEILPGGREGEGLRVAGGTEDLLRFLREGGHYSGPLPPEVRRRLAQGSREDEG